ncbi:MAG: hypothetical protein R3E96_05665 [Planctomycetota bacterium]
MSRDDVAPDVRPTLGRGPKEKQGPRGAMTATQLRERERTVSCAVAHPHRRRRQAWRRAGVRGPRIEVTESPMASTTVSIEPR